MKHQSYLKKKQILGVTFLHQRACSYDVYQLEVCPNQYRSCCNFGKQSKTSGSNINNFLQARCGHLYVEEVYKWQGHCQNWACNSMLHAPGEHDPNEVCRLQISKDLQNCCFLWWIYAQGHLWWGVSLIICHRLHEYWTSRPHAEVEDFIVNVQLLIKDVTRISSWPTLLVWDHPV